MGVENNQCLQRLVIIITLHPSSFGHILSISMIQTFGCRTRVSLSSPSSPAPPLPYHLPDSVGTNSSNSFSSSTAITIGIIWTDGSIGPSEAISESAKVFKEHLSIFVGLNPELQDSQIMLQKEEVSKEKDILNLTIEDLDAIFI